MLAEPLTQPVESDHVPSDLLLPTGSDVDDDSSPNQGTSRTCSRCCGKQLRLLSIFFAVFWIVLFVLLFVGLAGGPVPAASFAVEPILVTWVIIVTAVKNRNACCSPNEPTKDNQSKQNQRRRSVTARLAWSVVRLCGHHQ